MFSQTPDEPILLNGFPIILDSGFFGSGGLRAPLTADFNRDGYPEIVIATRFPPPAKNKIHIIKYDGTYLDGWPKSFSSDVSVAIAAGDVDGNGTMELCGIGDSLYVFNTDGIIMPGFPVSVNDTMYPHANRIK